MNRIGIIGFFNSGTTLLMKILSKHPDLKVMMEKNNPNYEEKEIDKILEELIPNLKKFNHKDFIKFGIDSYAANRESIRQKFWEKFSSVYKEGALFKHLRFFYCHELLKSLDMKKIILLRDGRHQVVSKRYWEKGSDAGKQKLVNRAKFWNQATEHYFKVWHDDPMTLGIRYEHLCSETKSVVRRICSFCELDFSKIEKFIPSDLKVRSTNWDALDGDCKFIVETIIDTQNHLLNGKISL